MAVRLLKCKKCNHKLRFGANSCGKCATPTPVMNREDVLGIAFVVAVALIFFVAII